MSKIVYSRQTKYLETLRVEQDELILEMENFAVENKIPILNWNSAEFLESQILIKKPGRVLEIGAAIAYSAIRVARNLKKNAVIDTIEKSKDNIKLAKKFIKKSGLSKKINLIEGDALKIMPQLEHSYDLIFLDADKEDYQILFHYSLMLLKKGGVLFVDNLLWYGHAAAKSVPPKLKNSTKHIKEFNKLFVNFNNLKTTIVPIGDGIGIGVKLN
ncbi:MAG: O-methyltransferase [Ignavibacteria bacterium]|jgi:predicted O-methyltransferase YrrM